MEELNDPKCLKLIKKMIKDTARFMISSGVSSQTTNDQPKSDVVQENVETIEEEPQQNEKIVPQCDPAPTPTIPAPDSSTDSIDFESMIPNHAPPPPPSDDEDEEGEIEDIPEVPTLPCPDVPNAPNVPPPPPPAPGPPPPAAPALKIKAVTNSSQKTSVAPQNASGGSMMDQISGFQFKEQNEKVEQKAPLQKEPSILDEIHNFKFKERKSVPTAEQLPKQNQDSLTALLSNQLTIFRNKLREDVGSDDDDDDDEWD